MKINMLLYNGMTKSNGEQEPCVDCRYYREMC